MPSAPCEDHATNSKLPNRDRGVPHKKRAKPPAEFKLTHYLLAQELQLLRVGTVSVDGTKIDANASKRNSIRYDRGEALREQLRLEIGALLERAEAADTADLPDPQRLPQELSRREQLKAKLDRASAELSKRSVGTTWLSV